MLRLLPWTLLVVAGGVVLFLNGLDPTGSVLVLAGMLGSAVTTIRGRWQGAPGRWARDLRRRWEHRLPR